MNKEEKLLSDLESDIDSDWEDIRNKILVKENLERARENPEREIPKRMMFPDFKEFYKVLYDLLNGNDYRML